ncbi:MAG TPA: ABC transporter ATP-binding protein [Tepidisphaeraceae bacterium]|jgi:ABC-2 type transport system ATP-binding protein|nr:ABC transporter ATP-binding protein [Tepidisphaeraceae bacterium]
MGIENGTGKDAPVLAVDRARVRFGKLMAVRDVSMSLRGGDLLGLIGPNGAGKTTLLRVLAGLQPLSRGIVQVLGEPLVPENPSIKRHIGFTPDTPAVYEELTVRMYLTFIAKAYDLTASETAERIDFWLEKVWLTEKADAKIKGLSRGMRQRIGLARTLLPNPALVLLDEPAAGLDPAGRVQFRQLLCDLRDQGKALIVSSHILSDMSEYCTHIGIMTGGAMVQYGTVAEIASHSGADGRCRYTIGLADPIAGLAARLAAIEGVADIEVDRERVSLTYGSDKHQAAALLAQLIATGAPVASFTAVAPGLEEAYLRAGIRQVD